MKKINWTITDNSVVVNYDGETHIVKREDTLADQLIKALKTNQLDDIPELVSVAKRVIKFGHGNFTIVAGKVHINGIEAPQVLSDKIIKFSNEGLPYQPLIKFAESLQDNPSYRAVNELYEFLEKNDHPITSDGCFIAFKKVRSDFKDIYSGKFDNSVGQVVEVPRNQVDEDSKRTCSSGLHVANWDYAHNHYGTSERDTDIMLEVEVNPADVVAIPSDYSGSKMRVCKYKVLGVVNQPFEPGDHLRQTKSDETNELYCEECHMPYEHCDCDPMDDEQYEDCCEDCCEDCYEPLYDCRCDDYCPECDLLLIDCQCEAKATNDGPLGTCSHCGEPDCFGECCEQLT